MQHMTVLTVHTRLPFLADLFDKKFGRFSAEGWKTCDEGAASREGDWWCDVDSVIFMWGKMQWRSNDSAEWDRDSTTDRATDRQTRLDDDAFSLLPPHNATQFPHPPPSLGRTADLSRRCNINDPHPVTAVCCLEWRHVLRPSEGENGRRRGLQTRLALMRFSFELRGGR